MNFLTDLAAIIGSTTDNGGSTPLASSASKDYAMKNWLHDSWAHLLEAQFDDVEGQGDQIGGESPKQELSHTAEME